MITEEQQKYLDQLIANRRLRGQKQQDLWALREALPMKREGYFLDLAAADGVTHSNTLVLERDFGWQGLCIEPNPVFFGRLQRSRKCSKDS